jgi:4-hydroxy-4-methyl-2-oxoglutarate aldolase
VSSQPKQLTGKIDPQKIKLIEIPRIHQDILSAFQALGDCTCAVSDALDELGIPGAIPGSVLKCIIPGKHLIGIALTLRNVEREGDFSEIVKGKKNLMAEAECHNLAQPGDVLVIQGVQTASNMGGVGGRMGKRQGELGAIVDGVVRDVADFKAVDYPIWSKGVTPVTGKWRVQSEEINGPVYICNVLVNPGDLVVADESGVCFVPRKNVEEVLLLAQKKARLEDDLSRKILEGHTIPDIVNSLNK